MKDNEDNIGELKEIIKRERAAKLICSELNNFMDLKPILITIITHIKEITNCDAVGIRLHDQGDYPYYVYNGFPESFIKQENSLCTKDDNGDKIAYDNNETYELDCMCGNIIREKIDKTLPFFSKKGSFWSNNTSKLLKNTTEKQRQSSTRNYCNSCGYESVALIPIKAKKENLGLIQLNDKRIGLFTKDIIEFIEMIGEQIGLAVLNSLNYTKLKESIEEIKTLQGIIPICSYCKSIKDDKGYWESVESYISKHSDAVFTHGLCLKCLKKHHPNVYDNVYEKVKDKDKYKQK